ncbi:MAG: superoxide dismutase [Proteobacteria bacterium]|nr:superoxide dismutase [Pseudomonadota bacterium]
MSTLKAEKITLPGLPYALDALEPVISARTLELHHQKHHDAYVVNTNRLVAGTELEGKDLITIINSSARETKYSALFNNAAQVFNHSFYWRCMSPKGGGEPHGEIARRLEEDFGSYEEFVETFVAAAVTQFGSGWAWLVLHDEKLEILKTSNADTPILHGHTPLLAVDVWEHAYYLDYQNRRIDYLRAFMAKLVDWDFVNSNLSDITK